MLLYPNCKLNIGLRVVSRRADGYHDLETVFYPVYGLHDQLEVVPAEQFSFAQDGLRVDCRPEDNLIIRCYELMRSQFPEIGPVAIRFRKHIPFGAGLGGGSSDAAHMAIALNELFNLGQSKEQLAELVRPLGADCPFFIYNVPCYAEGIGDRLRPIEMDLSGLRLKMLKPACGVSTREAYAGITLHPEAKGQILGLLQHFSLTDLPAFVNDFEQTVFPLHPEIEAAKTRLLNEGALYAAMSGSGSTVFGLFEHQGEDTALTGTTVAQEETAAMVIFDDTLGKRQA
ncbi:MAG: 4-(cytidine 5'-diphospho)-2-C-methyl-D-erythritol kinase [Paludibacteraceae bacterium]|nr:4-(cytidine 5'-diphospho)-2-C-methyl-D-erythritol kinase [Paludibacteraceae bacterium]